MQTMLIPYRELCADIQCLDTLCVSCPDDPRKCKTCIPGYIPPPNGAVGRCVAGELALHDECFCCSPMMSFRFMRGYWCRYASHSLICSICVLQSDIATLSPIPACVASDCAACAAGSVTTCATCNPGFVLVSGTCSAGECGRLCKWGASKRTVTRCSQEARAPQPIWARKTALTAAFHTSICETLTPALAPVVPYLRLPSFTSFACQTQTHARTTRARLLTCA